MRCSIEPIYVKRYGFLSFAKNMSNKYSQKLLHSAKKCTADAIKTASKRAIQKTAEATRDSIGNKTADKITKASKELHSKNNSKTDKNELEIPKQRYIFPEKREEIIDELRLVQYNNGISKNNKFVRQCFKSTT